MKKIFTIVDYPNDGKNYGKYISNTPGRAANKAFSQLSKVMNIKNSNSKKFLVFTIKDTSNKKLHKYVGTRVKLNKPIIVNRNGKTIEYKFKNIVTTYSNFVVNKL
jgi:hypothetical protein